MQEIAVNTFNGGLDYDTAPSFVDATKITDAKNVTLTSNGNYFIAENIVGATEVGTLIPDAIYDSGDKILGVYEASAYNGVTSTYAEGILSFLYKVSDSTLRVYFYDLGEEASYYLFSEVQTGYNINSVDIDVVKYTEADIDTFYFTDNVNEPRGIKLDLPATANNSTPSFSASDVSILRRGMRGYIDTYTVPSLITNGGSLLCGNYQISLRFFNSETNKYSKWTVPTQPITISETTRGTYKRLRGGVNMYSNKGIQIFIKSTAEDRALYDKYQIAVISNIGTTEATTAVLRNPENLTLASHTYQLDSNKGINTIPISDIVVDKAAIKTCKTLQIKDNRLFLGNIEYHSLEYDNGNPTVSVGSVITETLASMDNDEDVSNFKSYRRGEVYRFAISYFDEYYNFSRPKILDMSGVTDNQISGAIDMKFPNQKDDISYGYFDNTSGLPQHLGLDLTITNHPTWAKGFVILRAKRIKRIEFQTPLIPGFYISGAEVQGEYPKTAHEDSVTVSNTTTYDLAQPMNPLGTWMPKNFFRGATAKITNGVSAYSTSVAYDIGFIFPPDDMMDDGINISSFVLNGQSIEAADIAFLNYDYATYNTTYAEGESKFTSVYGTFYAVDKDDYYYSGATGTKATPYASAADESFGISEYGLIPAESSGTVLSGSPVCVYNNLVTETVPWGNPPTPQKLGAVALDEARSDIFLRANPAGANLQVTGGGINAAQFGRAASDNTFSFDLAGGTIYTDYVNVVEIVNVVNSGINDNRYGGDSEQHELIPTGAFYLFSDADLAIVEIGGARSINLEVWGGDTIVGLHQYKITNSHYGLIDSSDTDATIIDRWGRLYNTVSGTPLGLTVPYDNLSQVISVMLESDYRTVLDSPVYDDESPSSVSSNFDLATPTSEQVLRSPFNYYYHPGYNYINDQKVFIPFNENETSNNIFKSRIAYSNQRIYQTDTVGFDLFNVLDTYDLNENLGELTGLRLSQDNLIGVQADGVVYVPVNARVLESSDALSLSVRSAEVIDTPRIITNKFGANQPRCSYTGPIYTYIVDEKRKKLLRISPDSSVEMISNSGVQSDLDTNGINLEFIYYDELGQEVYFVDVFGKAFRFNEKFNIWQPKLDTNDNLFGLVYANGSLNAVAETAPADVVFGPFDTGSDYFGSTLPQAYIQVAVNANPFVPKVFDNLELQTDNSGFGSIVVEGYTNNTTPISTTIDMTVATNYRDRLHGLFYVPITRGASGQRIRGARSLITLNWENGTNVKSRVSSITTKYRQSKRAV